jgi:hypothetical protein
LEKSPDHHVIYRAVAEASVSRNVVIALLDQGFLLALAVGLRLKEIDLLEWSSFRWEDNVVRVKPTRYFHPKREDSIADLPVDAEVMIFRR